MNFTLFLIAFLASCYFAKEAYDDYRIGWAMFWAGLIGWYLHTLLGVL